MMSIGVGSKIYIRGAKPNTHTWWPTSSLRSWLHFGALLFLYSFYGKLLMFGLLVVFAFCKHEKLVPLSAFTLSQACRPQKNQENIPNLYHKLKFPIDQVFFMAVDRYYQYSGWYYRSWEVSSMQTSGDGSAVLAP
jgi:hypothetical protein